MSSVGRHPNLLVSLFDWRPRDTVTPAENFLTEAFVYVLRQNAPFRQKWLTSIIGDDFDNDDVVIETRASYPGPNGTTIFPDIEIVAGRSAGVAHRIIVENKWGSPHNAAQLHKYAWLLREQPNAHLVFVCASLVDYTSARIQRAELVCGNFVVSTWEAIYQQMASVNDHGGMLGELVEFMDQFGLSPGAPITGRLIQAFVESRDLIPRLRRLAEKLRLEHDWSIIPEYSGPAEKTRVRDAYGRIAIEFASAGWECAITVGFLYNNDDHGVPFADSSPNSVDLMLRIEAKPELGALRDEAIRVLAMKADGVRSAGGIVRLLNDRANRNRHTLLIAQYSLVDVVRGKETEREQAEAIYGQIRVWLDRLFDDDQLPRALLALSRHTPNAESAATLALDSRG